MRVNVEIENLFLLHLIRNLFDLCQRPKSVMYACKQELQVSLTGSIPVSIILQTVGQMTSIQHEIKD